MFENSVTTDSLSYRLFPTDKYFGSGAITAAKRSGSDMKWLALIAIFGFLFLVGRILWADRLRRLSMTAAARQDEDRRTDDFSGHW